MKVSRRVSVEESVDDEKVKLAFSAACSPFDAAASLASRSSDSLEP